MDRKTLNTDSAYSRYLGGDDSALAEIISEYRGGLILYLNNIVRDINAADELCSETFVKLAVKKPRFSGRSSFKTFLYEIAKNTALDSLRKNKRAAGSISEAPELPAEIDLEQTFIKKERSETVRKAVDSLKPEYAEVLRLVYFDEMSAKEAASAMNKSLSAAEALLHRAKKALRKELEKEGFDYDD